MDTPGRESLSELLEAMNAYLNSVVVSGSSSTEEVILKSSMFQSSLHAIARLSQERNIQNEGSRRMAAGVM